MFSLISERKLGDRRRLYLVVHSERAASSSWGLSLAGSAPSHITKLMGLPRRFWWGETHSQALPSAVYRLNVDGRASRGLFLI